MIRDYFLSQNAFHAVDAYSTVELQYKMAKAILEFRDSASAAIAGGAILDDVVNVQSRADLMRGRFVEGHFDALDDLVASMKAEIAAAMDEAQGV